MCSHLQNCMNKRTGGNREGRLIVNEVENCCVNKDSCTGVMNSSKNLSNN